MATIPNFVDRVVNTASISVSNIEPKGGYSLLHNDAAITVGLDSSFVAEPDAGFIVVANANTVVKNANYSIQSPTSYKSSAAIMLVSNTDYNSQFVEVYLDSKRAANFSSESVLVVEPQPQRVFWS